MVTRDDWKAANLALAAIDAERAALLAPTEERRRAARARLYAIEEEIGDYLGSCENCEEPIFEGEPYHNATDVLFCKRCTPTYADMLDNPESYWIDKDEDLHHTPETAKAAVDAHIAAGGSITDKLVSR